MEGWREKETDRQTDRKTDRQADSEDSERERERTSERATGEWRKGEIEIDRQRSRGRPTICSERRIGGAKGLGSLPRMYSKSMWKRRPWE